MIKVDKLQRRVLARLLEAGLSEQEIQERSPRELLDLWLRYEGIIGYTDDIIDTLDELRHAKEP